MPHPFLSRQYHPFDRFTKRRAIQCCEDVTGCKLLVRSFAGIFSFLQPSKNCYESNKGSFHFTHSISDIPMTPSCSLRSSSNRRLVNSELHSDTRFEIYGSTIRVQKFGMLHTLMPTIQCRNSRTNSHPQPPYQASAWSYR